MRGEVELKARDAKAATVAWGHAAKAEPSARTALRTGAGAAGSRAMPRVPSPRLRRHLKASPNHVSGRLLIGKIEWEKHHDEVKALAALEEASQRKGSAAPGT